ncbi:MAG: PEP-CTERM system histidine kinase PrsK [Gammaproteobacteria bacterium]|nr:PEP-CTERM system histidine kinase PrsK [Gammaproteobacteria bacterium]MDH4316178.1 PEP-CTERM system histidine kinase PrsK [Gammaproteobacteria bacterium]
MATAQIAAIGYSSAGALFLLLTVLLLSRWRDRSKSPILALASLVTALWAGTQSASLAGTVSIPSLNVITELSRGTIWLVALALILRSLDTAGTIQSRFRRYGLLLPMAMAGLVLLSRSGGQNGALNTTLVVGSFTMASLILVLIEQIYRNTPPDSKSGIRYFCVAVAGMFLYDALMFGSAILAPPLRPDLWAARGFVNALLVVPLAYSVGRRFRLSLNTLLPRQILFYSFTLAVIGGALLLVLTGDFYIRRVGGTWAEVLRIVFLVAVLLVAVMLLVSPLMRARARVLLMKALFQYKYDYRREWLRFIATLSESGAEQVPTTAVRAVAQIVDSPGGVVWAQQAGDPDYVPVGSWRYPLPLQLAIGSDSSLVAFLNERQWIIDLSEMKEFPERYEGLELGELLQDEDDWWLIVPMLLGNRLSGFIVLLKPRMVPVLNFEDHDLLKTVGRHVGTHIDQAEADRRLAEASQFGAYNRLTAFLMHDLNNLIAQQSLVVKNAERFRDNPDFVDDAIDTIAHSVSRMRRLMEQLSSGSKPPVKRRVNVCSVLSNAIERNSHREPVPEFAGCDEDIMVLADADRLSMVIEHLLRNAQEATPANGQITVEVKTAGGMVVISIVDTGCGMSQDFIRDRLFRPFDSTKGSQSMGIGAYQARDYASALGGRLDVRSAVGEGTTFILRLPLAD